MNWFATFLMLWALGTTACAAAVPPAPIGAAFFRFVSLAALAMVATAALVGRPLATRPWPGGAALAVQIAAAAFAAAVLATVVLLRARPGPPRRALVALPAAVGAALAVLAAVAARPGLGEAALMSAHLLTSAALLGASFVAMILGHWYLANAALSFDLLIGLTRLLVAAALAKLAVSGVYAGLDAPRLWSLAGGHFDGILLIVRVLAGLVGGLVLALMAYACARIRSNQSATGILYVAVFAVLIGELTSIYLTFQRGLPV